VKGYEVIENEPPLERTPWCSVVGSLLDRLENWGMLWSG